MPTPDEWCTIADAAERLKVSSKTIRRMISRGEIDAHRISARLIRVKLSSLGGRPIGNAR